MSDEKKTPVSLGEIRMMLAETMREVRYGHMNTQQGIAVAKIAAQIANLMKAEIDAWRYLEEVNSDIKTEFGKLPVHREPKFKAIAG